MKHYIAIIASLFLPVLLLSHGGYINLLSNTVEGVSESNQNQCIEYNSIQKLILIKCGSIHLTDIYNALYDSTVLKVDKGNEKTGTKVWILNAGIIIDKGSTLMIDSSDTSWLKITATPTIQIKKPANVTEDTNYSDDTLTVVQNTNSSNSNSTSNTTNIENGTITVSKNNENNPNGIHVHGSLIIDSVKITSWDPDKNDVIKFDYGKRPGEEHTKSEYDTIEPRPFIQVSDRATGTTNITDSELAYLGYSCSKCSGLSYYGGIGSVIAGNDIHHLLKGFYSKKMGYMVIENNNIHDNYLYGIDPHTGTHDMIIRNNKVHHNNATAVVCSKDCYDILIENNEVYENLEGHRGIAYSINSDHSIIQNNYVHDQDICIGSNRLSDYNKIYNNTLSNCRTGIDLTDTSYNIVSDNKIVGAQNALVLQNLTNKIINNKIYNSTNGIVITHSSNSSDSINSNSSAYCLNQVNLSNEVMGTENPLVIIGAPIKIDSETHLPDFENETVFGED